MIPALNADRFQPTNCIQLDLSFAMITLLLVDDQNLIRQGLKALLELEPDRLSSSKSDKICLFE